MIADLEHVDVEEARAVLATWIEKISKNAEGDDLTFRLHQKALGGAEVAVEDWPFTIGEDAIEALIESILETAEEEARRRPGKTRFSMRVDGKAKPCNFTLEHPMAEGVDAFDEYGEPKEPGTGMGLLGQLMRHNEVTMRSLIQSTQIGRDDSFRQLRATQDENERLRRREHDNALLRERLISMEWARAREEKKLDLDEDRKDKIIGMLAPAVPILAQKVFGAAIPPGVVASMMGAAQPADPGGSAEHAPRPGVDPIVINVARLFSTLDTERMIAIGEHLSPEERAVLMAIHQDLLQRQQAAEAAAGSQQAAE